MHTSMISRLLHHLLEAVLPDVRRRGFHSSDLLSRIKESVCYSSFSMEHMSWSFSINILGSPSFFLQFSQLINLGGQIRVINDLLLPLQCEFCLQNSGLDLTNMYPVDFRMTK
ncbi:unnamed protein product [Lactuca virosa]|uniref:Uncharacterized protein n=1 Tax=Lactuca virosa TaxID=75947 RepID=A0AAU9NME7_9ASTR|nr:unnamed protein product [Lactuca virosa]